MQIFVRRVRSVVFGEERVVEYASGGCDCVGVIFGLAIEEGGEKGLGLWAFWLNEVLAAYILENLNVVRGRGNGFRGSFGFHGGVWRVDHTDFKGYSGDAINQKAQSEYGNWIFRDVVVESTLLYALDIDI